MIIRRLASALQLITQPNHAALSARIMRHRHPDHFPDSARKASILHAIEEHDAGWAEIDDTLVVDDATGQLVDFVGVSAALKRETSWRRIERIADDPYAAALVSQHRLHVYSRYAEHPEWRAFFADVTTARDTDRRAAGSDSLEDLLRDYRYVRLGDLASLAFCNTWPRTEEYGYAMVLEGTSLVVTPDPVERPDDRDRHRGAGDCRSDVRVRGRCKTRDRTRALRQDHGTSLRFRCLSLGAVSDLPCPPVRSSPSASPSAGDPPTVTSPRRPTP